MYRGDDVLCMYTEFSSQYVLTLAHFNDKQFYQETLPKAIFCCLQTCLFSILILLIENISFVRIALTINELHCLICPHYNVFFGAVCCCFN